MKLRAKILLLSRGDCFFFCIVVLKEVPVALELKSGPLDVIGPAADALFRSILYRIVTDLSIKVAASAGCAFCAFPAEAPRPVAV